MKKWKQAWENVANLMGLFSSNEKFYAMIFSCNSWILGRSPLIITKKFKISNTCDSELAICTKEHVKHAIVDIIMGLWAHVGKEQWNISKNMYSYNN
jgi:hypothetical protein